MAQFKVQVVTKEEVILEQQFENFWKAYVPINVRKTRKDKDCKDYFKKAVSKFGYDFVMDRTAEYIAHKHQIQQSTSDPFRWLRDELNNGFSTEYPVVINSQSTPQKSQDRELTGAELLRMNRKRRENGNG